MKISDELQVGRLATALLILLPQLKLSSYTRTPETEA